MTAEVVRLIDRAPVSCGSPQEIGEWLVEWAQVLRDGDYGNLRSLILVTENADGRLGVICQSVNQLDLARIIGLLTVAAHRKMDGNTDMADMA